MDSIYIPSLAKAPDRTEAIAVREFLPDLSTLMPVRGELRVTHRGNYLEVKAWAEAIITFTCHRCLQQYNERLKITPSELIWLEEKRPDGLEPLEQEIPFEDLVETLSPQGNFEPGTWLYEQFCLAFPSKQLCDANCTVEQVSPETRSDASVDRRWSALDALKGQLPN
ncbi:MAG: YceD family protein [Cyanobacteriota bacterium]|nr:YceD family protein [Cyanobacteriota bacterium]